MNSQTRIITLLLLFAVTSRLSLCSHRQKYNYHLHSAKAEADIISSNHIKRAIVTKSYLDSIGLNTLTRIDRIKIFNDLGLCIVEIVPEYKEIYPKRRSVKGQPFDIRDLDSEPTGVTNESDTIYQDYDSAYQLIKRITINPVGKVTEEWTYEVNGNEVLYCHVLENTPMKCIYTSYSYDGNKIISMRDSSDDNMLPIHSSKYFYDSLGNVINDGKYFYKIDSQNRVYETTPQEEEDAGERVELDGKGRVIERTYLYYNSKNKQVEQYEITRFKYDSRNLRIEEKKMSDGKAVELLTYTYE
jgi:hypothetical protein